MGRCTPAIDLDAHFQIELKMSILCYRGRMVLGCTTQWDVAKRSSFQAVYEMQCNAIKPRVKVCH